MIKNVLQITCDRCKQSVLREDDQSDVEALEQWLSLRPLYSSNEDKHLCVTCTSDFHKFMANEKAVEPRVPDIAYRFGFGSIEKEIAK